MNISGNQLSARDRSGGRVSVARKESAVAMAGFLAAFAILSVPALIVISAFPQTNETEQRTTWLSISDADITASCPPIAPALNSPYDSAVIVIPCNTVWETCPTSPIVGDPNDK